MLLSWLTPALAAPAALGTGESLVVPAADHQPAAPIVGGEPAQSDAYPSVVALYTRNDKFGCTGTLIAPDVVLSAGHCGLGMVSVLAGTSDLDDGGTWHDIAETWVHPDYASTFDVAVYRLTTPVEGVEPTPLLLPCDARELLFPGAEVFLVGFGDIDAYATESTTQLHVATTTIEDPYCADPVRDCNVAVSPGGELIAGGNGVDTCDGDSGGPLFVEGKGQLWVAGVTSRQAKPVTVPCGDGGIYPRVDAVAAWIEESTGLALEWGDCPDEEPINLAPVVRIEPLQIIENGPARAAEVVITDDIDQNHEIVLLGEPPSGRAWVDDGRIVVQAGTFSDEDFTLEVEVTDDADPPLSTVAELSVEVLGVRNVYPARGCQTAGAPIFPWSRRR